jgi:hypothetical protein
MLEPRLADWLREIGGRFFSAGAKGGCFVAFCGCFWRKWGGRMWCFDGESVVNCVVDVVDLNAVFSAQKFREVRAEAGSSVADFLI